jgi:hypothetical protein
MCAGAGEVVATSAPAVAHYASDMPEQTSPADEWTTVLDIAALRIEIRAGSGQPTVQQPWFDVRLHARSAPFAGTVETAWFIDDLRALRAAIIGVVAAAEEEAEWRPGDPLPDDDSVVTSRRRGEQGCRAACLRWAGELGRRPVDDTVAHP